MRIDKNGPVAREVRSVIRLALNSRRHALNQRESDKMKAYYRGQRDGFLVSASALARLGNRLEVFQEVRP